MYQSTLAWSESLIPHRSLRIFLFSIIVATVLTPFTYWVGEAIGWITPIDMALLWTAPLTYPMGLLPQEAQLRALEFWAVWTSYSCTLMCTFQTRWNYPMGVITTALYSILYWNYEAPALALFNLYLVFSLAYGWFRWKSDNDPRPVTRMNAESYWIHGLVGVCITVLFVLLVTNVAYLNNGTDFSTAFYGINPWDLGLAVGSGVAQLMLDNKKLENWVLWIIVDIVSIPYFIYIGLPLVAFQYVFFLANAFWGFVEWKRSMKIGDIYSETT